jgi:hypothetical protein
MAARYQKLYRMRQPNAKELWDKLASDHQVKVSKDVHGLRLGIRQMTTRSTGSTPTFASQDTSYAIARRAPKMLRELQKGRQHYILGEPIMGCGG